MRWSFLLLPVALTGCKLVGCNKGEVDLNQYDTVSAPVVGGGVTLTLGDVELGKSAKITVTAPNGDILAVGELERQDELPFRYGGKDYVVVALWYEDHTIHMDRGGLRVERRKLRPRPDRVLIDEGGTGPMPKRPDEQLRVGPIEVEKAVDVWLRRAGGDETSYSYWVGKSETWERDGAVYSLSLVGVSYERGGVDRAVLRFRPGRH